MSNVNVGLLETVYVSIHDYVIITEREREGGGGCHGVCLWSVTICRSIKITAHDTGVR